jgi:acylphosphatase
MAETRLWLVHGRVQGVFFRESTRRQALGLGLSGHALNLSDGSVEVLARGANDALDQLEAWLHHGPSAARVERLEQLDAAGRQPEEGQFTTGNR